MKLYTLDDRNDGGIPTTKEWEAEHAKHMCWRCGMLDRRYGLPDIALRFPQSMSKAHLWGLYKFQILVMSTQFAEFIGWDIIQRDLITSRLLHADGSVQDNGIACWGREVRLLRAFSKAGCKEPCEGCGRLRYSGGAKKYTCSRTPLMRDLYMDYSGGLLVTEPIAQRLQDPAAKHHFRPRLNLRFTPVDVLPEPIDGYPDLPDAWRTPTSSDDPPMWQNSMPYATSAA